MFMNIFINSYLKNISVDKAILIAKQFSIDFSKTEMLTILPYLKSNWQGFLDETKRPHLLNELTCISSQNTVQKTNVLLNKLLIILS